MIRVLAIRLDLTVLSKESVVACAFLRGYLVLRPTVV